MATSVNAYPLIVDTSYGIIKVVPPRTFTEIHALVDSIDGWLSSAEGRFLYRTAQRCHGKGVIVEIGSWKGKSTIWLASGSLAGQRSTVYAIDPHVGNEETHGSHGKNTWTFEEFKKNITAAGVADIVHPIINRSEIVARSWRDPVKLLWIDGSHTYAAAQLDFDLWYPFLIKGGLIAYHDNSNEVRFVVRKNIFLSNLFIHCGMVDSIAFGTKTNTPLNWWEQWQNRRIAALENFQNTVRYWPIPRWLRKYVKAVGKHIINLTV